jgi:hypothetical protein
MGKGMEMGRSAYEQPGTEVDRILSQQGGFQVSKGNKRGSKGNEKGKSRKQGDCTTIALCSIFVHIMNACNV